MIDDLKVTKFSNGDNIISHDITQNGNKSGTVDDWKKAGKEKLPAWCYNKVDTSILDKDWRKRNWVFEGGNWVEKNPKDNEEKAEFTPNGLLYNFYAISDSRGLAPEGWRIPNDEDFKTLEGFIEKFGLDNYKGSERRCEGKYGSSFGIKLWTQTPSPWDDDAIIAAELKAEDAKPKLRDVYLCEALAVRCVKEV
jgi:hypothetical protein